MITASKQMRVSMSWLLMRVVWRSTKIPGLPRAFERRVVAHGGGAFDAELVGVGPQQEGNLSVSQQRHRGDASNVQKPRLSSGLRQGPPTNPAVRRGWRPRNSRNQRQPL